MGRLLNKICISSVVVVSLLCLTVGIMYIADNKILDKETNEDMAAIRIEPGESLVSIAEKLKIEGVIKCPKLFCIYGKVNKLSGKIKFGLHSVSRGVGYKEIYENISSSELSSDIYTKLTIPEGFTVRQIAERLASEKIVNEEVFLKLAKKGDFQYWFLEDVPYYEGGYRLEGFLYPQTYYFEKGISEKEVIDEMLKEFEKNTEKYKEKYSSKKFYDIIKLASIVERETFINKEKDIVAGVFYNRLNQGVKLESCATVEYVLNTRKKVLSLEDISIDSEYNTYKELGLTPTPISNPSVESIKAASEPLDTEYMFFVAKNDGSGHMFAKTYKEHLKNIESYRD